MKLTGMNTAIITSVIDTDRSAQLAHRVDRRLAGGSVPLIEFGVDSLHDDDRVIDDDCDRKHHSRQRQQVNAEPDQVQHEERTTSATGMAIAGISVERKSCRKM